MVIKLSNPTGRNTQARRLDIFNNSYFFSYETCIGFDGWVNGERHSVRLPNLWGPTTGRHFNEMECSHYDVIDDLEKFNRLVASSLTN